MIIECPHCKKKFVINQAPNFHYFMLECNHSAMIPVGYEKSLITEGRTVFCGICKGPKTIIEEL